MSGAGPQINGRAVTAATVASARALLLRTRSGAPGLWPRAAALLARQSLESTLDEFWRLRGLAFDPRAGRRQQLICLRGYLLGAEKLTGRLHHTWAALSRACHHHPYELAPTVGELETHIGVIEAFREHLAERQA